MKKIDPAFWRIMMKKSFHAADSASRISAQGAIRVYQLTLSALVGRHCRHLPSCSDYTSEAIGRHGLWAGGWMGLARICRCRPGGTAGFDPTPDGAPPHAHPLQPWRYGRWRGPLKIDLTSKEE